MSLVGLEVGPEDVLAVCVGVGDPVKRLVGERKNWYDSKILQNYGNNNLVKVSKKI